MQPSSRRFRLLPSLIPTAHDPYAEEYAGFYYTEVPQLKCPLFDSSKIKLPVFIEEST